jgi:hypothetical protein
MIRNGWQVRPRSGRSFASGSSSLALQHADLGSTLVGTKSQSEKRIRTRIGCF